MDYSGQTFQDKIDTSFDILKLPEKYDLVVNDTFELFWNGIMLCKDYTRYYISAVSNIKGHSFRNKFEVSPTAAGTYPLEITISDDAGKIIDSKTVQLVVKQVLTTSPSSPINVLCMGASDTFNGTWPDEFARRLCGSTTNTNYKSGTTTITGPMGLGLSNINFVGTKTTPGGYRYQGTGGWTWDSYMSTAPSGDWYITVSSHNKETEDQESIYVDSNGKQWQLETLISDTQLMIKKCGETTTSDLLPASGTLTYVSGGSDTSDIVYTSCERGGSSPFVFDGEVNFSKYCEHLGIDKLDYVFSLLVFNSCPRVVSEASINNFKAKIVNFLNSLIKDCPDAKLVIMDSYLPCYDGCGVNYTSDSQYGNSFRTLQEWAFAMVELNKELKAEYPNNVDYISLAGIFDSEHNFPTQSVKYNNRNTTAKFSRQNNGLHPITEGYFQVADALFRFLNNALQ